MLASKISSIDLSCKVARLWLLPYKKGPLTLALELPTMNTPEQIKANFKDLYDYARKHPSLTFVVVRGNPRLGSARNACGYTSYQLANFFGFLAMLCSKTTLTRWSGRDCTAVLTRSHKILEESVQYPYPSWALQITKKRHDSKLVQRDSRAS